MLTMIKPSEVKKPLMDSVWQNCERETVAENILKLARRRHKDRWDPFSWSDYVDFCDHTPSSGEKAILDEFVEKGYLDEEDDDYVFTQKIIDVYMQYVD